MISDPPPSSPTPCPCRAATRAESEGVTVVIDLIPYPTATVYLVWLGMVEVGGGRDGEGERGRHENLEDVRSLSEYGSNIDWRVRDSV